MSIDLGRLVIAAQRAQNIADTAALAAASELPTQSAAQSEVLSMVQANNSESSGWDVRCTAQDVTFAGSNGSIDGFSLGPYAQAMKVTVHADVEYAFARLVGRESDTVSRSAVVMRAPVEGVPIATMWISDATPLNYGQRIDMLMADGPHYPNIPGSFGFLREPAGCTADWFSLLQGYGLSAQDLETSFVQAGDNLTAKPGLGTGHIRKALLKDGGDARLERGTSGKWQYDTFTDYHQDNPRIMLVPLVTYVGGGGANATFRIERFGAFWLEDVTLKGKNKEVGGRFIQYDMPGGDPNSGLSSETGIFATQLVR
jgi:hypothetical protein